MPSFASDPMTCAAGTNMCPPYKKDPLSSLAGRASTDALRSDRPNDLCRGRKHVPALQEATPSLLW